MDVERPLKLSLCKVERFTECWKSNNEGTACRRCVIDEIGTTVRGAYYR